jgi:hypothetical protein
VRGKGTELAWNADGTQLTFGSEQRFAALMDFSGQ